MKQGVPSCSSRAIVLVVFQPLDSTAIKHGHGQLTTYNNMKTTMFKDCGHIHYG